jgi:hypothetical protein
MPPGGQNAKEFVKDTLCHTAEHKLIIHLAKQRGMAWAAEGLWQQNQRECFTASSDIKQFPSATT